FFYLLYRVNLNLAVFNLLPVPPLDGSKIFYSVLPDKYYYSIMKYEQYIGLAFLLIIFLVPGALSGVFSVLTKPFDLAFGAVGEWVVRLIYH
ncbi:MAG: site-2 protease family protein, partial [Clostridia bacterium]|nr:site-2 protease family protein [Clostridia bacterium]